LSRPATAASRECRQPRLRRLDHLPQHDLGIAEHSYVRDVVAVDLGRIDIDLDVLRSRTWARRHGVLLEAAADGEDRVGRLRELRRRQRGIGRPPEAADAEREPVILRERALAVERGRDRQRQHLGEANEFVARLGKQHARAHVDVGPRRLRDQTDRGVDRVRIAAAAHARTRRHGCVSEVANLDL
jgi:hypothetical protein